MKLNDYNNLSNIPGIYLIRNIVNNKCYVGQTIRLKTRMQDHYSTAISKKCENQRKRMLLYKAIEKYGVDNFEYSILFSEDTSEFNKMKSRLDDLEKKYITEYNSYIPYGYNQTKGGDAGVLGLKMTNEQKELISKKSSNSNSDGRYMCYCYDMIDKSYYTAVNTTKLQDILHLNNTLPNDKKIHHSSCYRNIIVNGRFIISRSIEDLKQKIEKAYKINSSERIGAEKYCKQMEEDLISGMSQEEFCNKYHVCKKSYSTYKKRAIPDYKREYKTLVDKEEFIKYFNSGHTLKECSEYFKINYRRCHKYAQKWDLNNKK